MKKITLVLVTLFVLTAMPALGWSASPWTTETTYAGKATGKLLFGLKNLVGGVTEVVTVPVDRFKGAKTNRLGHAVLGLGEGVVNAVVYTVGGALHVVTFPLTGVDVPLPDNGVKCPVK